MPDLDLNTVALSERQALLRLPIPIPGPTQKKTSGVNIRHIVLIAAYA